MTPKFVYKGWFVFVISILLLTDLAILLNIPFLRQILGFLFLTILPGLLIFHILKLNKIESIEKFVLSVGLSISFIMFFGLLLNNLFLSLGYETLLATIPLLISFNLVFIVLAIIGCKINKEPTFSLPNLNLNTHEKAFLIVPVIFPALSIFGMHIMNTTNNNILLIFLLFLIPIYVAFVCFFNHKFPKRLYPIVIFLISISLLLLLALRSNHIIGVDTHTEYYLFRTTLNDLHWSAHRYGNALDACLSISILPVIYQSVLNIRPEFLYKILYSLLYSVCPLAIYVISKKYVNEGYAFLASCFFMFQPNFLLTEYNARTNTAILFFALAMMTLFSDRIDPLKKRILFIVFLASCIVSHYSTAYIFFFIMLGAFVGMEILSKKYTFKKIISVTIVILFFALIFFWYSQVTETAFNAGVGFIENTFNNLNRFFVEESRGGCTQALLGEDIMQKGIPHKIQFVFTWLTFALIGIGIITTIIKRKEMSFPELKFEKPDFFKEKFEVIYFVIALTCSGLLVAMVAVPYLSRGYNLDRLYAVGITILSVFFVIGGIILSQNISSGKKAFWGKKSFTKKGNYIGNNGNNATQQTLGKFNQKASQSTFKKDADGKNALQVGAYLVILLVLIPYFFCVTGVMYNLFGVPRAIILNYEGEQDDLWYIHDEEVIAAKWLSENNVRNLKIYSDAGGGWRLRLGYEVDKDYRAKGDFFANNMTIGKGYIYLRNLNVVEEKVHLTLSWEAERNIRDYLHLFVGKSKIYTNGGSEIWGC